MRSVASLSALLLVGLCACSEPAPRPEGGERRVISLAPAITEILVALGAGSEIVGVDQFSRKALGEHAPHARSLGALFTPDLERTIELAPTLVIGVASEQQSAFFATLRSRGVQVEAISPHSLADVLESYETLGALVGRTQQGAALRAEVQSSLDALEARAGGTPPRVAIIVEREPLYVVGGKSFVSELAAIAGGRNVFADLDAPYPQVSIEVLIERAPDVIIDTSAAGADGRYWSRFGLEARIAAVPQGVLTLPGTRLPRAAELLHALLHAGDAE